MRKLGLGVLLFVFGLGACATTTTTDKALVFDSSVSEEESCYLWVQNYSPVVKFNDTNVEWRTTLFALNMLVKIPAGRHTLTVEHHVGGSNDNIKIVEIKFDFEAGKAYSITEVLSTKELEIQSRPMGEQ